MAFAGSRLRELAIPIFADMLATEHLLTSGSTVVLRRRAKEHGRGGSATISKVGPKFSADLVGTSIGQPQHPRFIDLFIRRLDPFLDFALGDVPFQGFRKAFSRLFLQYCQHQNGPSKSDNFVFRSFVQVLKSENHFFLSMLPSLAGRSLAGTICRLQISAGRIRGRDGRAGHVLHRPARRLLPVHRATLPLRSLPVH